MLVSPRVKAINESITEQLRWTSDGEAHGTGDLEIVESTGFRGIKEPVEDSYSFGRKNLMQVFKKNDIFFRISRNKFSCPVKRKAQ